MTFVLVPGAWLGAWCWDDVVALLREAGQDAIGMTLTGIGERAHLLTPEIGLRAHVSDVVTLLRDLDLSNVVLVGHSYGGTVNTAAADEVPERVRWLVYLDGAVPLDGESNDDVIGADKSARLRENAVRVGDAWCVPPPSVADWGLPAHLRDLVERRLTPHPLRSLAEPIRLRSPAAVALKRAYLRSSQKSRLYGLLMDRARRAGWWCKDLPGGHYPMLTMPRAVGSALLELTEAASGDAGDGKHDDNFH
jgi:pimeloyl-ACP methyl ester carboxylesterase